MAHIIYVYTLILHAGIGRFVHDHVYVLYFK